MCQGKNILHWKRGRERERNRAEARSLDNQLGKKKNNRRSCSSLMMKYVLGNITWGGWREKNCIGWPTTKINCPIIPQKAKKEAHLYEGLVVGCKGDAVGGGMLNTV